MRSIPTLLFGALAVVGATIAFVAAPSARGSGENDPAAPAAPPAAPAVAPPAADAPTMSPDSPKPAKEPEIKSPLLLALVGEWGCECAYPTGGHAAGTATAKFVLDNTAVMTESSLDWTVGDKREKVLNLAIWKVGADGKSLSYWGFSSHDGTADLLTGQLTETSASVTGSTKYGPMRLTLTLKDGVLSQQLWIDKTDMGVISYKKK